MVRWRLHSRRVVAGAAALLLQAALYRLLVPHRPSSPRSRNAPAIIALILTASPPRRAAAPPHRSRKHRTPRTMIPQPLVQPITRPAPPQRPSRPALDWRAGIQQEVQAELSRAAAPPKLRFGFPPMPAGRQPTAVFGWDEARIHRIQRLENGIIDLGDHCLIKLPFPIPICHFGRSAANGELFQHLHDRQDEPNSLP